MFLEGCDMCFIAGPAYIGGVFLIELDGWLRGKWGIGAFEN